MIYYTRYKHTALVFYFCNMYNYYFMWGLQGEIFCYFFHPNIKKTKGKFALTSKRSQQYYSLSPQASNKLILAKFWLTKPEIILKLIFQPTHRRISSEWYLIHIGGKLVDVSLPMSKFVIKVDRILIYFWFTFNITWRFLYVIWICPSKRFAHQKVHIFLIALYIFMTKRCCV